MTFRALDPTVFWIYLAEQPLFFLALTLAAYLIGSIPMGFVIVKAVSGQDVRQVGSGRTGGTACTRAP